MTTMRDLRATTHAPRNVGVILEVYFKWSVFTCMYLCSPYASDKPFFPPNANTIGHRDVSSRCVRLTNLFFLTPSTRAGARFVASSQSLLVA